MDLVLDVLPLLAQALRNRHLPVRDRVSLESSSLVLNFLRGRIDDVHFPFIFLRLRIDGRPNMLDVSLYLQVNVLVLLSR